MPQMIFLLVIVANYHPNIWYSQFPQHEMCTRVDFDLIYLIHSGELLVHVLKHTNLEVENNFIFINT